ncbi:MAG: hypothetical protein WC799_18765 [Desulfobacteraceae bacterium]|jgi:hypothetical protein
MIDDLMRDGDILCLMDGQLFVNHIIPSYAGSCYAGLTRGRKINNFIMARLWTSVKKMERLKNPPHQLVKNL